MGAEAGTWTRGAVVAERNTIASTVPVAVIAQTPVDWSWSASLSALELLGAVVKEQGPDAKLGGSSSR